KYSSSVRLSADSSRSWPISADAIRRKYVRHWLHMSAASMVRCPIKAQKQFFGSFDTLKWNKKCKHTHVKHCKVGKYQFRILQLRELTFMKNKSRNDTNIAKNITDF
uniref:Uncharacterized protein n=1 Tax=Romanomermis culicivorax TaxID=13658 RepID=A0A915IN79_ROMCU